MGLEREESGQKEAESGQWKAPRRAFFLVEGEPGRGRTRRAQGRTGWGHSCGPSLAVNPVFDPSEDGKDASRARPSVSGTRQSPPASEAQDTLTLRGHMGAWSRAGGP